MNGSKGIASFAESYAGLYRHRDGVLLNTLALGYVFLGYPLALFLLCSSGIAYVAGVLLLAHVLIIAAYLIHECVHGSLFQGGWERHLPLAGTLAWITGACYGDIAKIRDKHLRHHFEQADIVEVDYRQVLQHQPGLRAAVEAGQACCLPAIDLLMHLLVILRPFTEHAYRHYRKRVLKVAALRLAFFTLLGSIGGWPVLLGYGIAYVVFVSVLNFMDAFQHSYLLLTGLDKPRSESPVRDSARFPAGYFKGDYEQAHTFSNLLSQRWPVLNLLVLNFSYHNAHHRQPMAPWYRLPALHREMLAEMPKAAVVPFATQLRDFFRYRVTRVMAAATDDIGGGANTGAAGVSFLTPL